MRLTKRQGGCAHDFEAGECRRCGYRRTLSDQQLQEAAALERSGGKGLNAIYRNGGALVEDREQTVKDMLWEMGMAAGHPEVLARDLARMGWSSTGDDPTDAEEE
jgi:hypothetical protein